MVTRRELLLLLRTNPGITVSELAAKLDLTSMGVRRHLDVLARDGLAETVAPPKRGVGRPAAGWRLTADGLELLPRRYDRLALELLEDIVEHAGPDAVDAVLARRMAKQSTQYRRELKDSTTLPERTAGLARIRDDEGYVAHACEADDGELLLTESNCAVHQVAERYPSVCAQELALLRKVMGPDVEVTRVAHAMAGDGVCSYRIRPVTKKPR